MICHGCMTELSGTPKFCPKCGVCVEAPAESAQAIKRCPQCGTENPVSAKFCKNDGYGFEGTPTPAPFVPQPTPKTENSAPPPNSLPVETSVAVAPPIQKLPSEPETVGTQTNAAQTSSKGLLIGIASVIAVVATGVGGYRYWSGNQAGPQAPAVQGNTPPPASVATRDTGSAGIGSAPAAPLPQAASPTSIEMAPKVDVTRIHKELNQNLQQAGFGVINASVNTDGSVNLDGMLASKKERDEVVRLALSQYGVERVNEAGLRVALPAMPTSAPPLPVVVAPRVPPSAPPAAPTFKPDPAKLEGDINRALRSGGIGGVTAQVGDDFSVTLKGSATSIAEKTHAFQITRQFKGVGATRDRVFVVE